MDALDGSGPSRELAAEPETLSTLKLPTADRLFRVYRAIRQGMSLEEISKATGYDLWFLAQMKEIRNWELEIRELQNRNAELKPDSCVLPNKWDLQTRTLPAFLFIIHHSPFIQYS